MTRVRTFVVAGARPNFMKVAPLYRALLGTDRFAPMLVHTGQHYDPELSDVFFTDLGLPRPDINLDVGSGSHGEQAARILERFEAALARERPGLVIVVGDVNSTVACALATAKMKYSRGLRPRLAHVEAGLRSFDRTMPEEVNRVVTDAVSDFLFTTEESANVNLQREGIEKRSVFFVGNVLIDTLLQQAERAVELKSWEAFGVRAGEYAVLTLHRPANVDDCGTLTEVVESVKEVARQIDIIFPAHPRTATRIRQCGLEPRLLSSGVRLVPPFGYLQFLSLMTCARMVLTDSGGIQEETTVLGIPCLTLRENTERPITVTAGTNAIVGLDRAKILSAVDIALNGPRRVGCQPPLWDGKAAERIAAVLGDAFGSDDRAG
jgi:UDP-N-acetylglucosamine 2-epimerase (non-hydrolysing)